MHTCSKRLKKCLMSDKIILYNFSVMSGRVFLVWTSTKQGLMCLAQGHNAVMPVRLEPATPLSQGKHYHWAIALPTCMRKGQSSSVNLNHTWQCHRQWTVATFHLHLKGPAQTWFHKLPTRDSWSAMKDRNMPTIFRGRRWKESAFAKIAISVFLLSFIDKTRVR